MPDIGNRIHFKFDETAVDGGGLLQSYRLTGGTGRGTFDGGRLAIVENRFGEGRTLLIGTNPSVAFYRTDGKANATFFAELVKWSGRARHATLSNDAVFARIHKGEKGSFLWLVNPTRKVQTTTVTLADGKLSGSKPAWPVNHAYDAGRIEVPARDVLILPIA
jgi:beta-galactosidase